MSPAALPDPLRWTELLRVFGGLVAVLAAFVAALWLLKRVQPGARGAPGPIRVVSTLHLAPRERLLLVEVGQQQLLLGSIAQGLQCLHVLSEPADLAGPGPGGPVAALPGGFPEWLRRALDLRKRGGA